MVNSISAFWTPGPIELIVVLIVFGIPILLIVLFVRYLSRSSKERQRLRLEVGKLADELEQMRKKTQGGDKGKSSDESA
jgi:type II secretory pathway pseudopilin PulG